MRDSNQNPNSSKVLYIGDSLRDCKYLDLDIAWFDIVLSEFLHHLCSDELEKFEVSFDGGWVGWYTRDELILERNKI